MAVVAMKQLLEAGVHFGHQTRRWDPKMAEYIFQARNGIHIIDLQKTSKKLDEAITAMLERMNQKERVDFANNVYEFIVLLNQNTLTEVNNNKFNFVKMLSKLNSKNKMIFMELIYNFIRYDQV